MSGRWQCAARRPESPPTAAVAPPRWMHRCVRATTWQSRGPAAKGLGDLACWSGAGTLAWARVRGGGRPVGEGAPPGWGRSYRGGGGGRQRWVRSHRRLGTRSANVGTASVGGHWVGEGRWGGGQSVGEGAAPAMEEAGGARKCRG